MKSILWILNGCGLEGKGITGGPVRFITPCMIHGKEA